MICPKRRCLLPDYRNPKKILERAFLALAGGGIIVSSEIHLHGSHAKASRHGDHQGDHHERNRQPSREKKIGKIRSHGFVFRCVRALCYPEL